MHYFILATILFGLITPQANSASTHPDNLSIERQALIQVGHALEQSLNDLRKLEKAKAMRSGIQMTALPDAPATGAMQKLITIPHWEGPLESLLKTLAERYQYQFHVIGAKPALPILVSIEVKDKPLGIVIQSVDWQAGARAHISVNDHSNPNSITLHYVSQVN